MSTQENIKVVRHLFDLFNKNDLNNLNAFDELLSPNVQIHDSFVTHPYKGPDCVKEPEKGYIQAFPNKTAKLDQIFGADDKVVVYWTAKGTHKGSFMGCSATNKNFHISGVSIYRLVNGKISEIWQIWDRYALLEQLGEVHLAHHAH